MLTVRKRVERLGACLQPTDASLLTPEIHITHVGVLVQGTYGSGVADPFASTGKLSRS